MVFDRIRENIKLMRREKLSEIVNRSINQTLSRTILTAGLTFLTVLALFLFGGEVLHGFSLALVIGILIGTYSSIAIAAPILVAYQDWRIEKGKRACRHARLPRLGKLPDGIFEIIGLGLLKYRLEGLLDAPSWSKSGPLGVNEDSGSKGEAVGV